MDQADHRSHGVSNLGKEKSLTLERMPSSDPFQVKLFYNYVTVISLYITYFLCVALVKTWEVCYIKNNVYNCKQYAQCPTSKQQQSIKQHIVLECVSEFLS